MTADMGTLQVCALRPLPYSTAAGWTRSPKALVVLPCVYRKSLKADLLLQASYPAGALLTRKTNVTHPQHLTRPPGCSSAQVWSTPAARPTACSPGPRSTDGRVALLL